VSKHLALYVVLAVAAGCGRPNDVGRLQNEAEGVVSRAKPEVAELEHRVSILKMRGATYQQSADYKAAGYTIGEAQHELDVLKGILAKRPAEIAAAANAQEDVRAVAEHLQAITDATRESVHTHLTIATADVTTGEAWLARAGSEPAITPPPPADKPAEPTATDGPPPTP
jgi:hypothetical protein